MIGIVAKRIAKKRNLKIDKGVVYGVIDDYVISLFDGAGTKTIIITTYLTDDSITMINDELKEMYLSKVYNIAQYQVDHESIVIVFIDKIGFEKYFNEFVDRFFTRLKAYNAAKYNICPLCGKEINDDETYRIIDRSVYHAHLDCLEEKVKNNNAKYNKEEQDKTYIEGFVGAIIGALIGGIFCSIFSTFSTYIAMFMGCGIIGLTILGYEKMNGKEGKWKIPIICICAILGVVIGAYAIVLVLSIYYVIAKKVPGATFADIPYMCLQLLYWEDMKKIILINLISGLCYVAFGAFYLIFMEIGSARRNGNTIMKIKNLK